MMSDTTVVCIKDIGLWCQSIKLHGIDITILICIRFINGMT